MDENNKYMLDLIDGAHGRTVKWMGRIILVLISCWLITIGAFIWYINQFDYYSESVEYTQDGQGLNIIGDENGVRVNGTEVQTEDNGQSPQNEQ